MDNKNTYSTAFLLRTSKMKRGKAPICPLPLSCHRFKVEIGTLFFSVRGLIVDGTMRPDEAAAAPLYVCHQSCSFSFKSSKFSNHSKFKHSVRNVPLSRSIKPFCVGLPVGRPMPLNKTQFYPVVTDPLSELVGYKLRAVITTDVGRSTAPSYYLIQYVG